MGKSSRMKKERKAAREGQMACEEMMAKLASNDPMLDAGNGVQLYVKVFGAGGGEFMGAAARANYWSQVCESMRGDDPAQLPAMLQLGEIMGLSIFDVEIPVFPIGQPGGQEMENIFVGLFLLEYERCLSWFVQALLAKGKKAERLKLAALASLIVASEPELDGTPRLNLALIAMRAAVEIIVDESGADALAKDPAFAGSQIVQIAFIELMLKKSAQPPVTAGAGA